MVTVDPPRVGPCTNWATENDVVAIGNVDINAIDLNVLAINLTVASEILWYKTGMQWSGGGCTQIIRPVRRYDLAYLDSTWWNDCGYPYAPALVEGVWYNFGGTGVGGAVLLLEEGIGNLQQIDSAVNSALVPAPRVDLGQYPVTTISEVKIDGAVLDPSAYRLDEWRYLTRVDGQMWPVVQDLHFPDSHVSTWSVAVGYGQPPPQMGVNACAQLAVELTKHCAGDIANCALPLRVTAASRQGVTYSLANVMDVINKGRTGLYFVDLLIGTANPDNLRRPARVLSPDLQPPRRLGSLDG